MHHVFIETNWVVDYAAPAHHKKLPAVELLGRADRGEIQLHLPAICLNEARRTLQKFQPRHEADAIRNFALWATRERKISGQDGDVVRRTLDLFELYDDAGIWVFGTFDLDEPPRPPGWGGTDSG